MKNPFRKKYPEQLNVLESTKDGFGTFGGVFTPSILTILGVIMYLRFGWVVGNVGLIGTLIIVTLSTTITFFTALSIASIATDQRVRTGGAYYMISRSLGIESGGAIGIPLYLAQALSVALYTVGFAESVVSVFPSLSMRTVGLVTTLLVTILALASARTAIRAQYFIMVGIVLSLISLLFGDSIEPTTIDYWGTSVENKENFWTVFAVFFPAVTGIMAGVNMSGDLKDPGKSIPKGTFAAVGVGYLIYMVLPIVLVMRALARDKVLPSWLYWLGRGDGNDDAPRVGTLVTLGVALIAVYLGNLNVIAPVITMFFLTTYGVLNITAGVERLLGSPSFRPKFKVHWAFSILGALGCIAVMFLINTVATIIAFLFVLSIFIWLERQEMQSTWGDVRRGVWMAITRAGLLRLNSSEESKTWRPHPLVLSGAPTKRWHLIDLAAALTHNRGMLTVSTVLKNEGITSTHKSTMEENIKDFLAKRGIQGLVRVTSAEEPFQGAERLVEAYGLGALVPNTVILGDSENLEVQANYCQMIAKFHQLHRNVLIVHDDKQKGFGKKKRIDIWWGGLKGNGGLMMILGYLLQSSRSWLDAEVYLKMVVSNEKGAEDAQKNLTEISKRLRTGAIAEVIVANGRNFDEILHQSSKETDLIFMGMAEPDEHFLEYYKKSQERLKGLPTTILVLAAEEISFGEVLLQQDSLRED